MKKLLEHLKGCKSCQGGALCEQGKTLMMAAMDAGPTALASAAGQAVLIGPQSGDEFDIQWMPPGRQAITCFVNDEARDMDFTVKPEHANTFNSMLQWLRARAAAGEGDEPFIDFNHDDGAASGRPTEMYWAGEHPKAGGIRLKGRWTGSGKPAVVNRDFTRFSPQWDFDPETDEPTSIGVNLGGLVNRAAFKTMQAVAKAATNQGKENEMTREEFNAWLSEGLKPLTEKINSIEAKAKDATTQAAAAAAPLDEGKIVSLVQTAIKPLTDQINTAAAKAAEDRASAAVQAHVKRGAIAPEDTETIKFYTTAHAKDAEGTEKVMAKLQGKSFTRVVRGSTATGTAGGDPQEMFMAKAKAFGELHKIQGGNAEVLAAFARSAEGKELYEQFRGQYVQAKAKGQ